VTKRRLSAGPAIATLMSAIEFMRRLLFAEMPLMDPLTQTIAEILYLRTMLRLPPEPIKDKEEMPVAEIPDPVLVESREESRRPGLARRLCDAAVTKRVQQQGAAMATGWRFFRQQLKVPRGWT
jgi:hypothetical protein